LVVWAQRIWGFLGFADTVAVIFGCAILAHPAILLIVVVSTAAALAADAALLVGVDVG
jgi:hypothetical protein